MRKVTLQALVFLFILAPYVISGNVSASPPLLVSTPQPTPIRGHVATTAEVQRATLEWTRSAHADTYDNGMGANATCARCKSPRNWQADAVAAQEALDCGACKRVPGAPRPELSGGAPINPANWKSIGCDVCHQPAGDSYWTSISFWDPSTRTFSAVQSSTELCGKCHEGRHGFQVIEEQERSQVHKGWECTRCHGVHGLPSKCTDCHDVSVGKTAVEHARHAQVNCTACHDAGGLSIWQDSTAESKHYREFVPVRFAHTLTSWPSHNLRTEVDCRHCHHPQGITRVMVASAVGCTNSNCHPGGAVLHWCPSFDRNPPPR